MSATPLLLLVLLAAPDLNRKNPDQSGGPPDLDHKRLGEIECHNESEKTQ